MTTAEHLEGMTDEGKFERLATAVLRRINPAYTSIVHLGMNASGDTIPSPTDGFMLVPNSAPPQFVMVAHTTTQRDALRAKWLHDHSNVQVRKTVDRRTALPSEGDDGDLLKAGRLASELRQHHPDATFIVVLTSNQRLSEDIMKAVYAKAAELRVGVEFVEQSILADYLDNEPEGQWLRRQHLGVDAVLLSRPLLQNLADMSRKLYSQEMFSPEQATWIERETVRSAVLAMQIPGVRLIPLIGESGFGKSTLSLQLLQKATNDGLITFWLPAQVVDEAITLEDALTRLLRGLSPTLQHDAGEAALRLLRPGELHLAVDDINRSGNGPRLLEKLLAWLRPLDKLYEQGSTDAAYSFRILCPVLPRIWQAIPEETRRGNWLRPIFIDRYSQEEAILALVTGEPYANVPQSATELAALANQLGNDPILIRLYREMDEPHLGEHPTAETIIRRYINTRLEHLAIVPNAPLNAELRDTLNAIATGMLLHRNQFPRLAEVQTWQEITAVPSAMYSLRNLLGDRSLCQLDDQSRLVFRHDRILQTVLVDSLAELIAGAIASDDIIADPFYSEVLGRALITRRFPVEVIQRVRILNPLALFEAIRVFGDPSDDYHQAIVAQASRWVMEEAATKNASDQLIFAVEQTLAETDSTAIAAVTDHFPVDHLMLLARLRNGDAASGARCFSIRGGMFGNFEGLLTDPYRDRIVEHAKLVHGSRLREQLRDILKRQDINDTERKGALSLAALLAIDGIDDELIACCHNAENLERLLAEAIWAVARCCRGRLSEGLAPLLKLWDSWPNDGPEVKHEDGTIVRSQPRKDAMGENLQTAFSRGISDTAVSELINAVNLYPSLRWPLRLALSRIDSPLAVDFIAREAAVVVKGLKGTNSFSPWLHFFRRYWSEEGGQRLSIASMQHLESLWNNEREDIETRGQAFRLWVTGTDTRYLHKLQEVAPSSPFFGDALWQRTRLGDDSAIPHLLPILEAGKQSRWYRIVWAVWCSEIERVIDERLTLLGEQTPPDFSGGTLNSHYELAGLITALEPQVAEELLNRHWDRLGASPLFVHAALFIGTPRCLELATQSSQRCPPNVKLFEHITGHYRRMGKPGQGRLDRQQLIHLEPFFNRFGDHDLYECARAAKEIGMGEWATIHIAPWMEGEYRPRAFPSREDYFEKIAKLSFAHLGWLRIRSVMQTALEDGENREFLLSVADEWFRKNRHIPGLKIAGGFLEAVGNRSDLTLLDRYDIKTNTEDQQQIYRFKEGVRFAVKRRTLN